MEWMTATGIASLKKGLAASPCSKKHDRATQIYGCKCSFEITTRVQQKYLSNTLYHIYPIHACKCSSKKYSIH